MDGSGSTGVATRQNAVSKNCSREEPPYAYFNGWHRPKPLSRQSELTVELEYHEEVLLMGNQGLDACQGLHLGRRLIVHQFAPSPVRKTHLSHLQGGLHMHAIPENVVTFAEKIQTCRTPDDALNALHEALPESFHLNVWGAMRFPLRWNNIDALILNETVFFHKSAPPGYWETYVGNMRKHMSMPYAVLYALIAPVTDCDLMRALEPIGVDRWPIDLARKFGVRDALHCPVGGKWGVHFWSKEVLKISEADRILVHALASYTAMRLEHVVPRRDGDWAGADHPLTPRERAVLRRLAVGDTIDETAAHLGLSRETVRTHLKKAQGRLGSRNRTHTVVQAVLLNLVP